MKEVIILLVIVLICCYVVTKSIDNRCNQYEQITVDKVFGTRIEGVKLASILGFPTINLRLDHPLPCGFYMGTSEFGKVTVIVGRGDRYRADVHFLDFNKNVDSNDAFYLYDLERVVYSKSDIVTTFNRGCC